MKTVRPGETRPAGKLNVKAALRTPLGLRVLSGAVLAPAALGGLYAGGAAFAAVVAFATVVMSFEWARMVERREFSAVFYALALIGAGAMAAAAGGRFELAYALSGLGALVAAAASMTGAKKPGWAAFGAVYVIAPSVALIWLRGEVENGRALTLMLFLIVWAADTGGYVGGRLVGGPKMSPAISPAKTWTGAVGGVMFGALAGVLVARWIYGDGAIPFYALAGASLGLASILGDMAESAFKRTFGVKDVSGFIPGHGGFLDRLDGMIFATTAMTLALLIHMIAGALGA